LDADNDLNPVNLNTNYLITREFLIFCVKYRPT